MNRCAYEQKTMEGFEDMRIESVVCPKPRRLCLQNPSLNDHIRPMRWPINHQTEFGDSKAGTELLDIILTKGSYNEKLSNKVASSPPFFCGSPPSRAPNPVVQDEQFGSKNVTQFYQPLPSPSSSFSSRREGCVRMKIGHKPAPVRIEGFDCLSRDRRNCSISAVA